MPHSYTVFDSEIRDRIVAAFPSLGTRILDVGAGAGKFRNLLYDYQAMHAVEVWRPTVERYNLKKRYGRVYTSDIRQLDMFGFYELVIFGDVLEHLSVEEAQAVLARCTAAGCSMLVAVPYGYEQGEVDGNPYEEHKQPDLTHERFMERYPGFRVLVRDELYGIYIRSGDEENTWLKQPTQERIEVTREDLQQHHVAIATPVYGGSVSVAYHLSMLKTHKRFGELDMHVDQLIAQGASVDRSRNQLVAEFMIHPEYTHLLFIDADQGWEADAILRLLAMDREVIGVAARKKSPSPQWCVNFLPGENVLVERGAMEVAEVGTGFLLIRRSALERMMKEYDELRIRSSTEDGKPSAEFFYALFQFAVHPDGSYLSEDLTFCRRWRAIGGQVWVDPTGDLVHVGQQEYRGALASLIQGLSPEPRESEEDAA